MDSLCEYDGFCHKGSEVSHKPEDISSHTTYVTCETTPSPSPSPSPLPALPVTPRCVKPIPCHGVSDMLKEASLCLQLPVYDNSTLSANGKGSNSKLFKYELSFIIVMERMEQVPLGYYKVYIITV